MVTLIILDGFGIGKQNSSNAIYKAGTPNLDKLKTRYSYSKLKASGKAVGLPRGQMGNSEVGHLTLGGGRIVMQDLAKIDLDIKQGRFKSNPQLALACSHAKQNNSALHIMGLLSDGGVHSHINHLFEIIEIAKSWQLQKVYIHAFTDGRDTPVNSGKKFIAQLESKIKNTPFKIGSICGRVYAMDREERYDRLQKAYNTLVLGENFQDLAPQKALDESYKNGVFDEFVYPVLLDKNATISDNDSVIFFNYRSDRAREITRAITDKDFPHFQTKKIKNLLFSPMQEYASDLKSLNTIYPPLQIKDNLSAIISEAGLKQYHIAETTKYAHVTFFFNGGIEEANKGEDRKLIQSIDTQDFSDYPKMRAEEITQETLEAIASQKYDFILVNYSNPDMIGHTGNFKATTQAISCVEKNAYALALATLMVGGECIITADHGNAEYMFDKNGNKVTSHTTNPVPIYFVCEKKKPHIKRGRISQVAPTILKLLNLQIPKEMDKPLF